MFAFRSPEWFKLTAKFSPLPCPAWTLHGGRAVTTVYTLPHGFSPPAGPPGLGSGLRGFPQPASAGRPSSELRGVTGHECARGHLIPFQICTLSNKVETTETTDGAGGGHQKQTFVASESAFLAGIPSPRRGEPDAPKAPSPQDERPCEEPWPRGSTRRPPPRAPRPRPGLRPVSRRPWARGELAARNAGRRRSGPCGPQARLDRAPGRAGAAETDPAAPRPRAASALSAIGARRGPPTRPPAQPYLGRAPRPRAVRPEPGSGLRGLRGQGAGAREGRGPGRRGRGRAERGRGRPRGPGARGGWGPGWRRRPRRLGLRRVGGLGQPSPGREGGNLERVAAAPSAWLRRVCTPPSAPPRPHPLPSLPPLNPRPASKPPALDPRSLPGGEPPDLHRQEAPDPEPVLWAW